MTLPPAARRLLPLAPYAIVGVAHLVMLLTPGGADSNITKLLLMPTLLIGVAVATRLRGLRLVIVASAGILFSWAGDALLAAPGSMSFLIGLGLFLCAHVAYVVLFVWPLRERRMPLYAAVFGVWWVVLVIVMAPFVAGLLIPVAIYGLAVAASAATALGATRPAALGALLFLVSDTILAFKMFVGDVDQIFGIDAIIMALYIAAQGLIAVAVVSRSYTNRSQQSA